MSLADGLKPLARAGACRFWNAVNKASGTTSAPVSYIVERGEGWSIRWDGDYYAQSVNRLHPGLMSVSDRPERLWKGVAHFGSQFVWQLWTRTLHPATPQLVTYFHGKPEDGPEMQKHVDFFLANLKRVARVITAAGAVEKRLLGWGVPQDKLARVPLGVDTALFRPPSESERRAARARFGVPEGTVCIGSFQKDGIGWGEGSEPKLIKGPDLFVEAAARLAKDFPVFMLLTGPARGYVKAGLARHGIPFNHVFLKDYLAVSQAYQALDLYLMTSREEGGPKALLECMASGVALVSARTGMADDLFPDPCDPRAAPIGDVDAFARLGARLLGDETLRSRLTESGRQDALTYDWSRAGRILYDTVYRPLLGIGA